MKQLYTLLVCSLMFSSFSNSTVSESSICKSLDTSEKVLFGPDPLIFQTWYLYSTSVDKGDPNYYYGPNVPQMTIFQDFSFTAIDNCWAISGNFEYTEEGVYLDFGLINLNNAKECVLGGSTGEVLTLIFEFIDTLNCEVWGDIGNSDLIIVTYPGFDFHFKNTITLSTPEHYKQTVSIYPNPVSDIFSINSSNTSINSVKIYTADGVLVRDLFPIGEINIDISELTSGIYFAKILSGSHAVVKKIIKK